ncbi:MAG: methyltransferase [Firmicutes bacterium]|nr:methyltransferase [Bacillota bacterium]
MERIDDLGINGLKLIQDDTKFCFGTDSVELANFVLDRKLDMKSTAIDLGAGNGIIAILLAGKKGLNVKAIEIDDEAAALCGRNIELNNLGHLVKVISSPMQDIIKNKLVDTNKINIVVSNPPYFRLGAGELKIGAELARHEVAVTQRELVETVSDLLSAGGMFFIVYPVDRMAELIYNCKDLRLEPKEIILLDAPNKPPLLFLMRAVKNAKTGLKVSVRNARNCGMEYNSR